MHRLYILYDPHCGLCTWARRWLARQPAFLDLTFIPAGSKPALELFPGLARAGTGNGTEDEAEAVEELVVISDDGAVYRNSRAWIMSLYALEDYREWALRLSHPLLLPLARQAFALISRQRQRISRWLDLASEVQIA